MKNEITGMKLRLIVMNFLQFAVWGLILLPWGHICLILAWVLG